MSIEVVLEGKLEDAADYEGYTRLIKELAEKWKLKMEEYEDCSIIEVCPEGYIEVTYEESYLSISAQTNVAGPGYHAFVCDFFAAIVEVSPVALNVNDPTQYYTKRDFTHLKEDVFYRWLDDLADYIEKNADQYQSLCISWPMNYYKPKELAGYVVTPLGYIANEDFLHMDIHALAHRFFIWNEKDRGALYYRNAALNLLWKECYYEYSNMNETTQRYADIILEMLEIAYHLEPKLPLPMEDYQHLCKVRGRAPKLEQGVSMSLDKRIGYRRDKVEMVLGNWGISVDGCAECDFNQDINVMYMMSPYHDAQEPWVWMYKLKAYALKGETVDPMQSDHSMENGIDISHDGIKATAFVVKEEDHTLIRSIMFCEQDLLVVEVVVMDESLVEDLLADVKVITHHQTTKNQPQA